MIKDLKNKMNDDDLGGALILGLNHLLIKSHGGSEYKYLLNSINVSKKLIENDLINKIKKIYGK